MYVLKNCCKFGCSEIVVCCQFSFSFQFTSSGDNIVILIIFLLTTTSVDTMVS